MMERAIYELGDMDEGEFVYITGPHTNWLNKLDRAFRAEGLVGVRFVSVMRICDGGLRGARGVLLIDDALDCRPEELQILLREQEWLERYRRL